MSGAAMAIVVARARHRIVEHFRAAGATAADKAVTFEPDGRVERRMMRRLTRFGALNEVTPGQYFLDEVKLAHFRRDSLATMLGAIGVAGLAAAAAIALGG